QRRRKAGRRGSEVVQPRLQAQPTTQRRVKDSAAEEGDVSSRHTTRALAKRAMAPARREPRVRRFPGPSLETRKMAVWKAKRPTIPSSQSEPARWGQRHHRASLHRLG